MADTVIGIITGMLIVATAEGYFERWFKRYREARLLQKLDDADLPIIIEIATAQLRMGTDLLTSVDRERQRRRITALANRKRS